MTNESRSFLLRNNLFQPLQHQNEVIRAREINLDIREFLKKIDSTTTIDKLLTLKITSMKIIGLPLWLSW